MKALIYIIIFLGLFGLVITYIIAYRVFEGTVTDDPYETGLKWDEINRQKREMGWTVFLANKKFKTGANALVFMFIDKKGLTVTPDEVNILLTRPATAKDDHYYKPNKSQKGRYSATINFPTFGYWQIVFIVTANGQVLRFQENIYVDPT